MDHAAPVEDQTAPDWVYVLVPVGQVRWQAQVMREAIAADLGVDELNAAQALDWMTTNTERLAAAITRKCEREAIEPPHVRIGRDDLTLP